MNTVITNAIKPINLKDKFSKFADHWKPKIIGQMNDYHFKLVKFQGDFVWHSHDDTDEAFIVLQFDIVAVDRDRRQPFGAVCRDIGQCVGVSHRMPR